MAYEQLLKNKEIAKDNITEAVELKPATKNQIIEMMEKRWNGTFNLIGHALSRKR